MADISAPSINTRTSLLKSAKASSLFFLLCICMEGIGKSFKPKTRLSPLNLNSQRVFKYHECFMVSKSNFGALFQRLLSKLGSQAHFNAMYLSFAAELSAGKGVKESKSKIKNSNLCLSQNENHGLKTFYASLHFNGLWRQPSPSDERHLISSFITVTRVVSNCFRSLIVTFRACKVTYEIIFLCNVYIEYSISWRPKFMIWRPQFFH